MDVSTIIICLKCMKELLALAFFLRFMDSSCQTLLFRSSIIVGLATAVAIILYFTPLPAQYPQSCNRKCHELDWPMICRVKLTLERYQTLGRACKGCPGNYTACHEKNCITVDGRSRGILTANRQFPGPALQVCQNDLLVIDVVNRIPGQSFGVHWKGQPQVGTPFMDGVPMITQCPIPSLTTFQYKFRASESGSHMWQVNTGEEIFDTLFGPLIVRQPYSKEIHQKLYDTEDPAHVVIVHPWNLRKENYLFEEETSQAKLLINGKTQENGVPAFVFNVFQGRKHRFRVFYAGGAKNCQIRLTVDKHRLLVIALDGRPIDPINVTSVKLFPGERFDFVLHADQKVASYGLRATPVEKCTTTFSTFAVIKYVGAFSDKVAEKGISTEPKLIELKTSYEDNCDPLRKNNFDYCLPSIRAFEEISEKLATEVPDVKLYFFYDSSHDLKRNGSDTVFEEGSEDIVKISRTNNITMMWPSSPLLSQSQQISPNDFCRSRSISQRCSLSAENVCECIHVVDIPFKAVVEIILINRDTINHVFHLHGYSFRVLGASKLPLNSKIEEIKNLDEAGRLIKRNFNFPVSRDTVAVINSSVAVIRFLADNPGYWMLDEEQTSLRHKGMSVVLKVGQKSHLPPLPKNFPKCGNWIGPEYFLV